jgi:DNA-binding CsgD family transcriptional regulator
MHTISNSSALQLPEARNTIHPSALQAALLVGLDRLAHGVAVLDATGRTLFANTTARALFMRLGWTESATGQGQPSQEWNTALQRVCQHGRRELVTLRLNRSSLVVALSPLGAQPASLAFVLFGRDEICGSVELQMFALHHKLTLTESQVLRQLCRGLRAADIARENGVTRNTVLTQIASIRSKTGNSSIRCLLDALARMPQQVPLLTVSPSVYAQAQALH